MVLTLVFIVVYYTTQSSTYIVQFKPQKIHITRNSSEDEIANVNFLYDDIVHTLQNTTDSCINSARDRRGYVLECRFTEVSEITQSVRKATEFGEIMIRIWLLHRSRSSKVTEFGTNRKLICDFLLVINITQLISCTVSEIQRSIGPKSLYSATPLVFNSLDGGVPLGRSP